MKISVIMPVLDEAADIVECLQHLQPLRDRGHEVIVVDGGSRDDTVALAKPLSDMTVSSPASRATQMNTGARLAGGDLLLFLHADTRLPEAAAQSLCMHMASSRSWCLPLWGRFDMRLSGDRQVFRLIEMMMNIRSRLTGVATGDQSIFVDRELFERIGGYPEIPLMEDIALSKALRQHVTPLCLRHRVTSSSRRWENRGVASTVLLMWRLRLYYFLGISPSTLARHYH